MYNNSIDDVVQFPRVVHIWTVDTEALPIRMAVGCLSWVEIYM